MALRIRNPRHSRATRWQRGVSLVELMVAMALSLVLLAGVLAILSSSRTTYETTDRLSRLQENGRFALDSIVRDVRSAGYIGCSKRGAFTNSLNNPSTLLKNFELAVEGYDAQGDDWKPVLPDFIKDDAAPGNDVLVVRRPRGDFEPVRVVSGYFMNATNADLLVKDVDPPLIEANDVVQISDCNARAVFQVTANADGVIKHAESSETTTEEGLVLPGNSSGDIGYAFTDTAELVPVQTIVYFLRERDGAPEGQGPSLYRRVSDGAIAEELVEGVERMQVTYGVAVGDKINYRRADEVSLAKDWGNVRTVRIALLVVSLSEYGTDTDQKTFDLLGTNVAAAGDRRMRQVFTSTINLRNLANPAS